MIDFEDHLVCPNSVVIVSDVTVFKNSRICSICFSHSLCFIGYYLTVNFQTLILKAYLALIYFLSLSSKAAPATWCRNWRKERKWTVEAREELNRQCFQEWFAITTFFLPVLKFPLQCVPLMKYVLEELQAVLYC